MSQRVAVIVGRFQVPMLTNGHDWLLRKAIVDYDKVLILIGDTKVQPNGYYRLDSHDPYPFALRKTIINEFIETEFSQKDKSKVIGIYRFEDVGNVELWNKKLDEFLDKLSIEFSEPTEFVMLGSRDSFVIRYSGKNSVCVLESPESVKEESGTHMRKEFFETYSKSLEYQSLEFRCGVLWAIMEMERLKNLNDDEEV